MAMKLVDTGLFENPHLAGIITGPKLVATTTLPVGTNFDGYLEMTPAKGTKEDVGEPVLKVNANFMEYKDGDTSRPPLGTTSAILEAMGQQAMSQQAMSFQATAPCLPTPLTEPTVLGADLGRPAGPHGEAPTWPTGPSSSSDGQRGDVGKLTRGVPDVASSDVGDVGKFVGDVGKLGRSPWSEMTSPFYIDRDVMEFGNPSNMILDKLVKMQQDNVKFPFPTGAFRNYNVWGCGYKKQRDDSWDWDEKYLWGPVPEAALPEPLLANVLTSMQTLWEDNSSPNWCAGVGVLVKLLQHLKVTCSSLKLNKVF